MIKQRAHLMLSLFLLISLAAGLLYSGPAAAWNCTSQTTITAVDPTQSITYTATATLDIKCVENKFLDDSEYLGICVFIPDGPYAVRSTKRQLKQQGGNDFIPIQIYTPNGTAWGAPNSTAWQGLGNYIYRESDQKGGSVVMSTSPP